MLLLAMTQTSKNFAKKKFIQNLTVKLKNIHIEKNSRKKCVKNSTLLIYRRRQNVNILYPANLPPE